MPAHAFPTAHLKSERTIALARVVLALAALFAVWLDPAEPIRYHRVVYAAHGVYVSFAVLMLALAVWVPRSGRILLLPHAVDIVAFSVFQYLTQGATSPFFVYFLFSVFCAAIRWGWRGSLLTGALVMIAYLGIAQSISRVEAGSLPLTFIVVRIAYLGIATWLLVYLGQHEARLRSELERLARWPMALSGPPQEAVKSVLEYSARLMNATQVVAVWETAEEPTISEASWSPATFALRQCPPDYQVLLPDAACELRNATFMATGDVHTADSVTLAGPGATMSHRSGLPVIPGLIDRLHGSGLASAPFRTNHLSGRIFFVGLGAPNAEALALTQVVAREVAASLDQILAARQQQELATREERVRVARDLHDGVLQGLTGVRLELSALARSSARETPAVHERLSLLERAIAMEQRELRLFIEGLEPRRRGTVGQTRTMASRLDSLRERIALEWKAPVTIRVADALPVLPAPVEEALPLMVHEAAVNALKHGQSSRVSVDVRADEGALRVVVSDDGCGFSFRGRQEHADLARSAEAPRSLLNRVAELGGRMAIDSSPTGSRVEMVLSL